MVLLVEKLAELQNHERAILRRAAGRPLRQAGGQALSLFYRIKPGDVPPWQEERCFAVTTMACLWRQDAAVTRKPFAVCLRGLASTGVEHRLTALLDCDWQDGDMFMLAKLVRLMRMLRADSATRCPDPDELFDDLCAWNSASHWVQKKWARAYGQTAPDEDAKTINEGGLES